MKRTWYLSLLLAFALGGSLPGYGQTATSSAGEGSEPEQVSAPIYFRLGKSAVDPTFMDNRRQMELFVGTLREILSNPDYVVNRVRVVGMASPDGSRERNLELAGARARSLADFLIRETGISEEKIDVVNGGENWDGLFAMIEASKDIPDKAKMLELRDQYGRGLRRAETEHAKLQREPGVEIHVSAFLSHASHRRRRRRQRSETQQPEHHQLAADAHHHREVATG